jgi:Na+/melibiose symporter-like transporter
MCRNKWGRRRPFIIVGSVLTTVSVFLLWHAVEYRNPFRTSKETITSLSPVPRSHLFSSASPSSLRRGDNDDNASPSLLPSELSNDYLSAQFVYFLLAVFAIRTFENVAASAFCGLVPDTVHPSQRGVVSGYLAAMATLGTLCGIVTSGFFIVSHSFAVYLSLSVCYLVSMLLTVTGTQETSFQRKNLPSFSFYQNLKSYAHSESHCPYHPKYLSLITE